MADNKKKKYPYMDTANLPKSNVPVKVYGQGNDQAQANPQDQYQLPAGLADKLKQMGAAAENNVPVKQADGGSNMKMMDQQAPMQNMIMGKSGKEYTNDQVKSAIANQQNADAQKVHDNKMSTKDMVDRSFRRTKLQKKYPLLQGK